MDDLDKQILQELQHNFPVEQRPYDKIAKKIGISPDELFERITAMHDCRLIRRIGASLDSRKLGFASTLAAVRVKPDLVEKASEIISSYHEVTHSYLRSDSYNIWFTLIATETARIAEILEEIRNALSLRPEDVLNLPVERLFKLDARFKSPK